MNGLPTCQSTHSVDRRAGLHNARLSMGKTKICFAKISFVVVSQEKLHQ